MSRLEEIRIKNKRIVNVFLSPILIVVLIYYIFHIFTYDQQLYLKNHKMVSEQEAITVEIIDFKSYTSPLIYYSTISINPIPLRSGEMVVRSVDDYIGKKIKVKQLSNGAYIRNSFVFTVKMRNNLIAIIFTIGLLFYGRIRKKRWIPLAFDN